jgi:AcrR family transcriptional regulator
MRTNEYGSYLYVLMGTLVKMASEKNPTRRGRLPAAERDERRHAVLDATEAVLLDEGYDGVTMLAIAKRAGASKETLYSWFGNRDGLFAALIERSADRSSVAIDTALSSGESTQVTLTGFAIGLLTLLSSPASIALNRAAMQSPELSARLLASGRHRVGPLVEKYLAQRHRAGDINAPEPAAAFELLYGLVVRDVQIRVLLGESAPSSRAIKRQAATAVDQFLQLVTTG